MKIGIIGLGKVGSAFLKACAVTAALQVVSVKAGRSPKSCARLAGMGDFQITSVGAEVLAAADVVLLAVPDGQIAAAAETLAAEVGTAGRRDILSKKVCLHCSGSLGLDGGSARFTDMGMAVDGDNEAQQAACYLAEALQAYPFRVPEAERSAYHAAACFCSNYLVTITAIAQQLFERWTPDKARALQFLLPLLDGTVSNLHQTPLARKALTGPIARGDAGTVAGHLKILPEELQLVYRELALQTVRLASENGSIDEAKAKSLQELLKA